jgi:hypothetical protein
LLLHGIHAGKAAYPCLIQFNRGFCLSCFLTRHYASEPFFKALFEIRQINIISHGCCLVFSEFSRVLLTVFIAVDIACPSFDDNVESRPSLPVHLAGRVAGTIC